MTKNVSSTTDRHSAIRFLLNMKPVEVSGLELTTSVLSYLRNQQSLSGTKEGCAEGDCGACTVVVAGLVKDQLISKTVNACIQFLPSLDGMAVFTVEYLRQADGALHPAQQAMVDCHGSQCGFCTPGFVMSLWQVYKQHQEAGTQANDAQLRSALTGNLCRCTGYRPILEAGQRMFQLPEVAFDNSGLVTELQKLRRDQSLVYTHQDATFYAPRQLTELKQLRTELPAATVLAGCTDIGLWVNKQLRDLGDIIFIGQVEELNTVDVDDTHIRIGAGASLSDAYGTLVKYYPHVAEMHERFASLPIRNAGTLGGNIANGSPIGDSMPWLIAAGARVVLAHSTGERTLLLQDFYLDYMQTQLQENELIIAIEVPLPTSSQVLRTYKVSKRYDSDISAVCGGFSLELDGCKIFEAVIAFGGVAAIPKRATACEQALIGRQWNEETLGLAQAAVLTDYQPLSDMRASEQNRQQLARNLLYRFYLETRADNPVAVENLSVFAQT